jgi:hypothetical protein
LEVISMPDTKLAPSLGKQIPAPRGNAATVNGFPASATPKPLTLLALDNRGKFPTKALTLPPPTPPTQAYAVGPVDKGELATQGVVKLLPPLQLPAGTFVVTATGTVHNGQESPDVVGIQLQGVKSDDVEYTQVTVPAHGFASFVVQGVRTSTVPWDNPKGLGEVWVECVTGDCPVSVHVQATAVKADHFVKQG